MTQRVLVVAHNHPDLHPGGSEIFARDLFEAYKRAGADALFLAATNHLHREPRPGTSFQAAGPARDEILVWAGHFDRFMLSQVDLYGFVPDMSALLEGFRPDVVHLHHLLLMGVEFISLLRRKLPDSLIVLTLHDYYPICAHDGLMVRTGAYERCLAADPNRCHRCFPDIAPDRFLMREINLKTHLQAVDRFVAPSRFLKERYVEWGLPEERIEVVPNGQPAGRRPHRPPRVSREPNVFGYFGNLNPWKGVTVLLEACRKLIADDVSFEVRIHGGAPFQSEEFTDRLERLLAETGGSVSWLGPYERDQLPALIDNVDWVVVPSIWWENAPLVIQEAQLYRRPVIASGIGGMAEMVADGETGMHVVPNDPVDLARVMKLCAGDADLWKRLSEAAVPPSTIDRVATAHLALFDRVLRGDRITAA